MKSESMHGIHPIISRALDDLRSQNIPALVTTFIHLNLGRPLIQAVVSLLDRIAKADLQHLISQLLSTLTDPQLYNGFLAALKAHIEAHPWATAFFLFGLALLFNPLAMAGFGPLGPIAGSLAAAWQSSMGGTVAAGSAFAILQSWGMIYSIVIPVVGTVVTAGSVAAATAGEQIKDASHNAWAIASAGGREVEKWVKEKSGSPVTD